MNIYVIAGPPGIGKSTAGYRTVPPNLQIIDQDLAGQQYKKEGFIDYQQLATFSSNNKIKSFLFNNLDFAIELNLGFQVHYDYLKSFRNISKEYKIHLILFFTDYLEICLQRAAIRHKMGGHLVKPAIIIDMYKNTIPLFKENESLFHTKLFIDITPTKIELVNQQNPPKWVIENHLFL